jgi:hypothetical protein
MREKHLGFLSFLYLHAPLRSAGPVKCREGVVSVMPSIGSVGRLQRQLCMHHTTRDAIHGKVGANLPTPRSALGYRSRSTAKILPIRFIRPSPAPVPSFAPYRSLCVTQTVTTSDKYLQDVMGNICELNVLLASETAKAHVCGENTWIPNKHAVCWMCIVVCWISAAAMTAHSVLNAQK